MKSACRAAAFCAALAGAMSLTRADDGKAVPLTPAAPPAMQAPPHVTALPPANFDAGPALEADPDEAMQQADAAHQEFLRQSAQAAAQTEARKEAYDNDWMLRGYTSELNNRGIATEADRDAAAAQEAPNPSAPRSTDDPLLPSATDANNPTPHRAPANPDASEVPSTTDAPAPLFLPPLLPPAGTPTPEKPVIRLDAWGTTTTEETIEPPTLTPTLLPSAKNPNSADAGTESSLDVPGLTAERQGLGETRDPDVSDQQMEMVTENAGNRARKDFLLPTAASNDSAEFFKSQSEALAAPNANAMLHPPVPANISLGPPPPPPSSATSRMPPPTGIRSHVADPFDLIGGHRY
jgi:hypothetical protein